MTRPNLQSSWCAVISFEDILKNDVRAVAHFQSSKGVHKLVEHRESVYNENEGVIWQSGKNLQPLQYHDSNEHQGSWKVQ